MVFCPSTHLHGYFNNLLFQFSVLTIYANLSLHLARPLNGGYFNNTIYPLLFLLFIGPWLFLHATYIALSILYFYRG